MDKLPENLSVRFRLYLNILPLFERYMMYTFLAGGMLLLSYSLYKFIRIRKSKLYQSAWIEDELIYNIDRKLSSYMPDRRFSTKELEVHVHSLTAPLNDNTITRDDL